MAKAKKDAPRYFTKALRCPDGSRKYIRGKTKEELERKVMQAQAELGLGVNINDNTTVEQFAQMWVDVYKRPHLKGSSLTVVLNRLNCHILPVLGGRRVRDVRPADCALVLSSASADGLAGGTVKGIRSTMKEMFECAVDNGIVAVNPVRKSVVASGRDAREREPLSEEQLDRLFEVVSARKGLETLLTFLMIVRYTGLRAGEALGLHADSIDLTRGELTVREQYATRNGKYGVTDDLKSAASYRVVPVPLPLAAHLAGVLREKQGKYLFDVNEPMLYRWVVGRLYALSSVDCNGDPRPHNRNKAVLDFYVHPHLLRHTFATRCVAAGMDVKEVQYLLGHSDVNMTLKIYSHYEAERRRESTADRLNSIFTPKVSAIG